jgi:hypothetical protein
MSAALSASVLLGLGHSCPDPVSQQNILYLPITLLEDITSTTSIFTSPDIKTDPRKSVNSMDQQSVVMYLSLKGLNAVETQNDLVTTFKCEAKSDGTLMY